MTQKVGETEHGQEGIQYAMIFMLGGFREGGCLICINRGETNNTQRKKAPLQLKWGCNLTGGDKRDRTADLLNAMASLVYTNEYNPSNSSK